MKGSLFLALLCLSIPGEAQASAETKVRFSLQASSDSSSQAFVPDTPGPLRPWFPDVVAAPLHSEASVVPETRILATAGREGDLIAARIFWKYQSFRDSLSTP